MKILKNASLLVLLGLLFLAACTAPEPEKTKEEKAKEKINNALNDLANGLQEGAETSGENLSNALDKLGDELGNIDLNVDEPVNFRELKKQLPKRIGGISLTDSEGSTSGIAGIKVSTLEATYKDGDKEVEVEIVDTGGLGAAAMAAASWMAMDVDRESSDSFERTTTIDGHKAYEKCEGNSCQLAVFVAKRFVVSLNSDGIGIKDLRKALKDIDLDDLEKLAKQK